MTGPPELLDDMAETYRDKNDDYGNSWMKTGELLWTMADEQPIVLEGPLDLIRLGLWTRRLDKMQGAFHGEFVKNEEFTFEDALNRHCDEGTYATMHASTHADDFEYPLADGTSEDVPHGEPELPPGISEADVVDMRWQYTMGESGTKDLADEYDISLMSVRDIVSGNWRSDLPGPLADGTGNEATDEEVEESVEERVDGSVGVASNTMESLEGVAEALEGALQTEFLRSMNSALEQSDLTNDARRGTPRR